MAGTQNLTSLARQIRVDILNEIFQAGSGHPGGSMSCADILAVLFGHQIKPGPGWLDEPDRDHVILSKGHAVPALYAVLAECGLIPREELNTLRQFGSRLQGHPDRTRLPAVEMSTGSLGQGLSVGVGLAWAATQSRSPSRSFVILGDGELDSGQVWEAIGFAGAHRLGNLVAIIDANGIQNDGPVPDVLDLRPYSPKLEAFGWAVREINGHDIPELTAAFDWAVSSTPGPRPRAILAHTVKGQGSSFMENQPSWHSHSLTAEQLQAALSEVQGND